MNLKSYKDVIIKPLVEENPITLQILGICSALAVTNNLSVTLVMCVAVTSVISFSNLFISIIRNYIPSSIRIIVQMTIIASLVIVVDELLKEHPIVLIEGLRGTAEKDLFQSAWSEQFQVVAIIADDETRFSRMQSRGRSEDGDRNDFEKRNQREKGWGLEKLISEADFQFSNNGDLSVLTDEVSKWFNSL